MPQRLMINRADYTHPVSKLLDHGPITGDADETDQWFDYVGHYGFSEDDVPALISLAGESDTAGRKRLTSPMRRFTPVERWGNWAMPGPIFILQT